MHAAGSREGPEEPRRLGDYDLLATLARGGMGAIHLARRRGFRPDIQIFCVVKTLQRTRHDAAQRLRRFEDEARVVVTLKHRAICQVFDVGLVDGEHYIAMELIEGVSVRALFDALARTGARLDPPLALAIVDEVLDGLEYAHTHRDPATGAPLDLVHRDVSPQNVMVSFQGDVKLIDFGLVNSTLKLEHTEGGLVVGKLAYMAPEQARGERVGPHTDVYSAAVVLYELLTARRFYGDLSRGAIQHHLSEGDYLPPLDDVPRALIPSLKGALAAEADARTASAHAFQRALLSSGVARATSRELRSTLQTIFPSAHDELLALQRGVRDLVPSSSSAAEVTHIASSLASWPALSSEQTADREPSATDTVVTAPALPAADAARSSRGRVWMPLAAALGVVALLATGLIVVERTRANAPAPSARVSAPAAPSENEASPVVENTSTHGDREGKSDDAPADPPAVAAHTIVIEDAVVDDASERADAVSPESARTRARGGAASSRAASKRPAPPPATRLDDLAAHFAYIERWCTTRAPTCSARVLKKRALVPSLDVVGLRALWSEAERCVGACRR